jgi:hypothetical protein
MATASESETKRRKLELTPAKKQKLQILNEKDEEELSQNRKLLLHYTGKEYIDDMEVEDDFFNLQLICILIQKDIRRRERKLSGSIML